jgi:hypothetical protein
MSGANPCKANITAYTNQTSGDLCLFNTSDVPTDIATYFLQIMQVTCMDKLGESGMLVLSCPGIWPEITVRSLTIFYIFFFSSEFFLKDGLNLHPPFWILGIALFVSIVLNIILGCVINQSNSFGHGKASNPEPESGSPSRINTPLN